MQFVEKETPAKDRTRQRNPGAQLHIGQRLEWHLLADNPELTQSLDNLFDVVAR